MKSAVVKIKKKGFKGSRNTGKEQTTKEENNETNFTRKGSEPPPPPVFFVFFSYWLGWFHTPSINNGSTTKQFFLCLPYRQFRKSGRTLPLVESNEDLATIGSCWGHKLFFPSLFREGVKKHLIVVDMSVTFCPPPSHRENTGNFLIFFL